MPYEPYEPGAHLSLKDCVHMKVTIEKKGGAEAIPVWGARCEMGRWGAVGVAHGGCGARTHPRNQMPPAEAWLNRQPSSSSSSSSSSLLKKTVCSHEVCSHEVEPLLVAASKRTS